jgi:ribosomal protein L11 methyltransferase
MTDWIEISLEVDGEGAEAVADALRRFVHQGISIEQPVPGGEVWPGEEIPQDNLVVRAYIPDDTQAAEARRKIEESLYYLSRLYPKIPAPTFRVVKEEDWAEAWKAHYHPIRVGKHLLIKPVWAEADVRPDDIVIEMDPGMAFGTGTHPSTQLCLRACEWFVDRSTYMLDLGTGSGILAIAAAKLGAYRVIARDIDEIAVEKARENVECNGVADRVIVQHGSLEGLITSARHFELAMANITAPVIIELAKSGLQHVIWPGERFIFSGIIDTQVDEVTALTRLI